jgi:ribosomal protein L21E
MTRKPTKEMGRKEWKNERRRRRRRVVSRHVSSFNDDDIITVVISDGFRVHPLPPGRSPSSHSYSFSFYLVHHD